jgi:hypothetical protein
VSVAEGRVFEVEVSFLRGERRVYRVRSGGSLEVVDPKDQEAYLLNFDRDPEESSNVRLTAYKVTKLWGLFTFRRQVERVVATIADDRRRVDRKVGPFYVSAIGLVAGG